MIVVILSILVVLLVAYVWASRELTSANLEYFDALKNYHKQLAASKLSLDRERALALEDLTRISAFYTKFVVMEDAIEAVYHDRPSAHSDEVWAKILQAREVAAKFNDEHKKAVPSV